MDEMLCNAAQPDRCESKKIIAALFIAVWITVKLLRYTQHDANKGLQFMDRQRRIYKSASDCKTVDELVVGRGV